MNTIICRKLVSRHKDFFLRKISEAEDVVRHPYQGSGLICKPKLFFEAVVFEEDYELLPFALLYIYQGCYVEQDEAFAMAALKELWEAQKTQWPAVGYVYSFCLNAEEVYDESLLILEALATTNYLPAIATLADLNLGHGEIHEAMSKYEFVTSNGYWPIWLHYVHLKYRHPMAFRGIRKAFDRIRIRLTFAYHAIKTKGCGESVTYLNFYSIKFDSAGNLIKL